MLALKGALRVESAAEIKEILTGALSRGRIVLDLGEVQEIDISCLQLFCAACRSAARSGKSMSIAVCSEAFRQAVKAAGLFPDICKENPHGDCLWPDQAFGQDD